MDVVRIQINFTMSNAMGARAMNVETILPYTEYVQDAGQSFLLIPRYVHTNVRVGQ